MEDNHVLTDEEYLEYNALTRQIIGAAIEVHKELGPGLLESIYEYCLKIELDKMGLKANTRVSQQLYYKGIPTNSTYILPMLVEDKIVVEILSAEEILPIHEARLASNLKLANKTMGLLINFNVPLLKDGVRRKINSKAKNQESRNQKES